MGSAFATKLTRHRAFEIGARKFARFAACVTNALRRHKHEPCGRAAADVLAFAAMALCLESRFAFRHVANFTAIAPAFEFHGTLQTKSLQCCLPARHGFSHRYQQTSQPVRSWVCIATPSLPARHAV